MLTSTWNLLKSSLSHHMNQEAKSQANCILIPKPHWSYFSHRIVVKKLQVCLDKKNIRWTIQRMNRCWRKGHNYNLSRHRLRNSILCVAVGLSTFIWYNTDIFALHFTHIAIIALSDTTLPINSTLAGNRKWQYSAIGPFCCIYYYYYVQIHEWCAYVWRLNRVRKGSVEAMKVFVQRLRTDANACSGSAGTNFLHNDHW